MRIHLLLFILVLLNACKSTNPLQLPARQDKSIGGSDFYHAVFSVSREEREARALQEILQGNMPAFWRKFVRVHTAIQDSSGRTVRAWYYVSPDYLSIGSAEDFARIPLTPMTAQVIADSFHCFLPTRKMVNDIFSQARVKLEPVPLYAFRDSAVIFWHHHLIIEGQRKGRKGLIAGIKKDVVLTSKIARDPKPDRVAIYGWHYPDGRNIQPLYTGHVNWYVDYSHGIRLVYRKINVDGKWMDYETVLQHPVYKRLLCDEEECGFVRY